MSRSVSPHYITRGVYQGGYTKARFWRALVSVEQVLTLTLILKKSQTKGQAASDFRKPPIGDPSLLTAVQPVRVRPSDDINTEERRYNGSRHSPEVCSCCRKPQLLPDPIKLLCAPRSRSHSLSFVSTLVSHLPSAAHHVFTMMASTSNTSSLVCPTIAWTPQARSCMELPNTLSFRHGMMAQTPMSGTGCSNTGYGGLQQQGITSNSTGMPNAAPSNSSSPAPLSSQYPSHRLSPPQPCLAPAAPTSSNNSLGWTVSKLCRVYGVCIG